MLRAVAQRGEDKNGLVSWPPTGPESRDLGGLAALLCHRLDTAGISEVVRSVGFVLTDGALVAEVEIWPSSSSAILRIEELAAPFPVEVTSSAAPLPRRL